MRPEQVPLERPAYNLMLVVVSGQKLTRGQETSLRILVERGMPLYQVHSTGGWGGEEFVNRYLWSKYPEVPRAYHPYLTGRQRPDVPAHAVSPLVRVEQVMAKMLEPLKIFRPACVAVHPGDLNTDDWLRVGLFLNAVQEFRLPLYQISQSGDVGYWPPE